MLLVYLVLTVAGLLLTVRLVRRQSRHAFTALAGTVLGALSIVTGFSVGIYLAPVALACVLIAAHQSGRAGRAA